MVDAIEKTYPFGSGYRKFLFWVSHLGVNMMTSSNGNIFRVTGPLCGEISTKRPVMRSFDVFLDLRLNKRLSKQSWGWWFETLSCSLWCHCNTNSKQFLSSYQLCTYEWYSIQMLITWLIRYSTRLRFKIQFMNMSWSGNPFRITVHLCREPPSPMDSLHIRIEMWGLGFFF